MTLWTNDILVSARRIYQAAGFELADSEEHHSFGQDLVGQHWRLELGSRVAVGRQPLLHGDRRLPGHRHLVQPREETP